MSLGIVFPEIDPVAFEIGPLVIRWYALAYLAGFLGGWYYASKLTELDEDRRPNKDDIGDFLTWMVVGVILGGRLGYVIFYNAPHYIDNPHEILRVWHGGMSFHGGLLGAILAMFGFAKHKRIPIFQLSDIVAVVATIGLFFGRIANFVNGELYGRITAAPWGVIFPTAPDDFPRHPSQLYEAFLEGGVLFIFLSWLYRQDSIRRSPGLISGVFLMWYALARFMVEFVREPDSHLGEVAMGFSMGQVLSIPMFLFGLGIVLYVRRYASR